MATRKSEQTCPECGAVYERTEKSVPFRDIETFTCDVCEHELEHFSGGAIVSYNLIRKPDADRT